MTKLFTIGQIYRLGLLKNREGESYKNKATISRIVNRMKFTIVVTPWGPAKAVSQKELDKHGK